MTVKEYCKTHVVALHSEFREIEKHNIVDRFLCGENMIVRALNILMAYYDLYDADCICSGVHCRDCPFDKDIAGRPCIYSANDYVRDLITASEEIQSRTKSSIETML